MNERIPRRVLLAALLAGGVGGLATTNARTLLDRFAPLSGTVWNAADRSIGERVESPYGDATVRRDEHGVPHVEAEAEAPAYFAVGYVQGFDRLAQMDLQRRQLRGELSAVVGDLMLESDEFHVSMDFVGAAEATWDLVASDDQSVLGEAYADGVTAAIEREQLPLEFELLDYEPDPWTPVDSMLMEKLISWELTGNFGEVRRAVIEDRLGDTIAAELFPDRLDHDVPILREGDGALGEVGGADHSRDESVDSPSVGEAIAGYLSRFESPPGTGSNSWVVSGAYTESGRPVVANDPHLYLMTPPVWYEQHVVTPETAVRGVTFPGVPFVVIGANEHGAWGFTNVGADVLDCYRYEIDDDGGRYLYDGEWYEFETETREIAVAGGENVTKTVRKTDHDGEHGHVTLPVIEREGETIAVAWTGLSATRTTKAIYEYGHSESLEDVLEATRAFDLPTQNLVYAHANGRTLYYVTGQLPIRTIDGEVVDGNRIFDGSSGEGEWDGFTAYGESTWEGFVPFEEKPHAIDPEVLATANQRVVDDPDHYVGIAYADPYRGARIYDRLDERVASEEPMDLDFHRSLQLDVRDERAVQLVPELLGAIEHHRERADDPAAIDRVTAEFETWDYRMERDSVAALVFARFVEHFRESVVEPHFEAADLDEAFYPSDWVVATLAPDSRLFDDRSRAETMVDALESAVAEIDDEGWDTYGDWNTTEPIAHPFGEEAPFLNYGNHPADGSRATVRNYRVESAVGASLRMVVEPGSESLAVLPGGNSGDYFSPHYDDQFHDWLDGAYRSMDREVSGDLLVTFTAETR